MRTEFFRCKLSRIEFQPGASILIQIATLVLEIIFLSNGAHTYVFAIFEAATVDCMMIGMKKNEFAKKVFVNRIESS